MSEWIRSLLDLILILTVTAGLVQVVRLIRSLADLRSGRIEMERFVREFNTTVVRAEAGVRGLRQTARETGDDLEKLVEKGALLRDELHYLVDSADQLAERLTSAASHAARTEIKRPEPSKRVEKPPFETQTMDIPEPTAQQVKPSPQPSSRAEKELMQALQKLNKNG